ncbi:ABC transporter ATP-binding protein [Rhizobium sp. BK068]|uniref:ABC transporter ATP-binding protein n=1 Tax=unclassified Rhizobium TaxID=2613769 RepID=UPI0010D53A63|nr:ABC transporter ATP-binding protein [Rhizobium sp. BK068]MBB4171575.1 ABC-type sugar transport system ATPase subunit [Rhizobium sp. BK538]TCM71161.1 iron(III) transport system ATP-binding protein [Rhizobium sp. BK068]
MNQPALECLSLSKSLGGKPVLRSLDLSVQQGEVVALVGASGSGKSTLLRSIAGLVTPDNGSIRIQGDTVWTRDSAVAPEDRNLGLVFQDYALWPHMTVRKNLSFGLEVRRLPRSEIAGRVDHALDITQLGPLAERRPSELSGGQQQRVAIARCLAMRPRLLLLDEPLSNLDAALRDDLRTEMMRLIRLEGITALYVTHDQVEAMAVSDRLAVMDSGSIVQFAAPQDIYAAPANAFVARFLGGFSLIRGTARELRFAVGNNGAILNHSSPGHNGSAMLVVRPEDGRPATDYPDNNLTGEVLDSAFHGRCWRLQVRVGGDVVRIDWPRREQPGSPLAFSLPPERCTVLPA